MSACSARGGITDWFLKEAPPKGCVTYKDPKTNQQMHATPSDDAPRNNNNTPSKPQQPRRQQPTPVPPPPKPTPIILPGILETLP